MDIDDILASVSGPNVEPTRLDLQSLTRAWVNEKCAPEILPWPAELMDRVLEGVRRQIELVEEQTGNLDPKTNFQLIILQTELERYKFLVRSFLRTRIAKIDRYALYYLNEPDTSSRLSREEKQYAQSHQTILQAHYHSSFLSQFPTSLQRLDDTAGGISMVEQPNVDCAVFVRALENSLEEIRILGTDVDFEMRKGSIYVVRWSAIKEYVQNGEAELL